MHGVFGEVYNAGTIDDLVALYEPDAFLVPQLGQRLIGLSAIRESLVGFVNLKGSMQPKRIRWFPTHCCRNAFADA